MALYGTSLTIQHFGFEQILDFDCVTLLSFKWEIAGVNAGWRVGKDSNMEDSLESLDIKCRVS